MLQNIRNFFLRLNGKIEQIALPIPKVKQCTDPRDSTTEWNIKELIYITIHIKKFYHFTKGACKKISFFYVIQKIKQHNPSSIIHDLKWDYNTNFENKNVRNGKANFWWDRKYRKCNYLNIRRKKISQHGVSLNKFRNNEITGIFFSFFCSFIENFCLTNINPN